MDFEQRRTANIYFYKLESETSGFSNEDTESVNSFQGVETDLVRDSSDTDHFGSEYEIEMEYDVVSSSEVDLNSLLDTSGDSDIEQDMFMAAAAAICDSSFEKWVTDGEDSDITSSEDTSFNRTDFWTCVKCKSPKNNPLYHYCEKCFQDRKTLFPPRPRPKKPKKTKTTEPPVELDALRSCLKGLSQDSGIGSSQECPPLGLDKIVIPHHLTGNAPYSSSAASFDEEVVPTSQQIPDDNIESSTSKQVTLNDIIKSHSSRKRQMSESSISDNETKRPRWRDIKKSPKRDRSSNSLSGSPSRKRKSTSCERVLSIKKTKYSDQHESPSCLISQSDDEILLEPQKTISANGNSASQESIDVCGKTSDLGSEISSGSGIFDKTEELHTPLVDSKEMCIFCNTTPINAGFLHGNIAHRCCCYKCAKRTWKAIKRCPMCNRKVNKVIRVY